MDITYKEIPDEKNIYVNKLNSQERVSAPRFCENFSADSIPVDFVLDLQFFQDSILRNDLKSMKKAIDTLSNDFINCQPNARTEEFFFENNLIEQIFTLLTSPPSLKIYKLTVWLIVSIFIMSTKFRKFEIIRIFESYGLLNFLLCKFNPNYERFINGDKDSLMKINLEHFDKILLPYYLHMFAYYCYWFNYEVRNIILEVIILPNRDIFFDDLDENDIVLESSFLLYASTFCEFDQSKVDYINWIITLIIQEFYDFGPEAEKNLLYSILNLLKMEGFAMHLFKFNFQSFLSKYINEITKDTSDDVMYIILILQALLLKADPSRVIINYEKLIEIGNSKLSNSAKAAFKLFRKGLKYQKNDSPFDNDVFFQKFLKKLEKCSFEIKSQYFKIIGVWAQNSSGALISKRSFYIIPFVIELLYDVSVTDDLNLILLQIIKKFFDNAFLSSPNEFQYLKGEFENNNGVEILEEIAKNSESPELNCHLSQNLLSIWSICT